MRLEQRGKEECHCPRSNDTKHDITGYLETWSGKDVSIEKYNRYFDEGHTYDIRQLGPERHLYMG